MSMPDNMVRITLAGAPEPYRERQRAPDTSNLLKAIEDAFKGVIWADDARVSDHVLRKRYSIRPRLEIDVRPVEIPANEA